MKYIDLTLPVSTSIPVFPGDPAASIKPYLTHEKDGCSVTQFNFPSHWATHIDAPYHMLPNGKKLDQFPVEKFIGQGVVIDAQGKKKIHSDILKDIVIEKGSILLVYTGYSSQLSVVSSQKKNSIQNTKYKIPDTKSFAQQYFQNSPYLTQDFAQVMVERRVKIVGMDFPNPDQFDSHDFPVHKLLLGHDILIIENLTNLQTVVNKRFTVYALPMKVSGDGGLARVIAQENG